MTTSLGRELPREVLRLLSDQTADEHVGKVALFLSTDDRGFPHVTALSLGELYAGRSDTFRAALNAKGTAVRNISQRPQVTLVFIEFGLCYYIKALANVTETTIEQGPLQPFTARCVELDVQEVLVDAEAGATIVAGPRYRRDTSGQDELTYWTRVRGALAAHA